MFKKLILCFLIGLSFNSFAGQSFEQVCIKENNSDNGTQCLKYDFRLTITSDQDEGRPGAFGLAAMIKDQGVVSWSKTKGFIPFNGGTFESIDGFYDALPYSQTYSVFQGTEREMCGLTKGSDADFYAGHGALSVNDENKMNELSTRVDQQVTVERLKTAFIQRDVMEKDNGKSGLVYSLDCSAFKPRSD